MQNQTSLLVGEGFLFTFAGIILIRLGIKEKYNYFKIYGFIIGIWGITCLLYLVLSITNPIMLKDTTTMSGKFWEKFIDFNEITTSLIEGIIWIYGLFVILFPKKNSSGLIIRNMLLEGIGGKILVLIFILMGIYKVYEIGKEAYTLLM